MAIENVTGRMRVPINTSTGQKTEIDNTDKASAKQTGQTDSIAITAAAQEIKKTLESSSSATLIDMERVTSVKKALAEGTYQINADKIAEKMMQHEKLMSELDKMGK
jgi:negative regulator of flagellin synthesis FlgM